MNRSSVSFVEGLHLTDWLGVENWYLVGYVSNTPFYAHFDGGSWSWDEPWAAPQALTRLERQRVQAQFSKHVHGAKLSWMRECKAPRTGKTSLNDMNKPQGRLFYKEAWLAKTLGIAREDLVKLDVPHLSFGEAYSLGARLDPEEKAYPRKMVVAHKDSSAAARWGVGPI